MRRLYSPVVARSKTLYHPADPVACACIQLIFIRHGSAIALSEFGEQAVSFGDVIVLGANTLCGGEPEGSVTVTALCLDSDYVVDQVYWQHASFLANRFQARQFTEEFYSEPAQILRLGEERAGMLMPWLDEVVSLSLDGPSPEKFFRMQSLLFAVLDVIVPYLATTAVRQSPTQRRSSLPDAASLRQFMPLRAEARKVVDLLCERPERRWTLQSLAAAVHLSPSQLGRIFVAAYGRTPMTYLKAVRAERLTRLLRETDLPIEAAMREVGWNSRGHAARMFRQAVGVTPTRYRELVWHRAAA